VKKIIPKSDGRTDGIAVYISALILHEYTRYKYRKLATHHTNQNNIREQL